MAEEKKQAVASDEISLKELILKIQAGYRYLLSKWLIILVAGIVGGAIGLVYATVKKPVYTGTLTFALEEKNSGSSLGAYAGLANQFGIDLGGGASGVFSGDNIMELMKSRRMVTKALLSGINVNGKEQSLADYYIDFNHLREKWEKSSKMFAEITFPVEADPDSFSFNQDSLMGNFYHSILKNNLSVDKPDRKLSIVAVTCKSINEQFAKYFTEMLVKNVSAFYIQTKTKQSASNVAILQGRLDSVQQAYNGALYSTAISIDQNLNPARAIVAVPQVRGQTQSKILGTEYAELVKNLEIARMTLLQETPLIQIIDRPILPLGMTKIGRLKGAVLGGVIFVCMIVVLLSLNYNYQKIRVKS